MDRADRLVFGPYSFDFDDRTLYRAGVELPLPPRARDTLACLLEAPGKVVSKEDLIAAVWQESFVSETALKEAVFLVRRALEDDPQNPAYIKTVHRRGYRFVAQISVEAPQPGSPISALLRRRAWVFVLAVVAVFTAFGIWQLDSSRPAVPPVVRAALEVAPSHQLSPVGLAVSADGAQVVYLGKDRDRELIRRLIDRQDAEVVAGTEGARRPFFSPDGSSVGFFAKGRLLTVPVSGGAPPRDLAPAPLALGGAWAKDGTIVFAGQPKQGLSRVDVDGGEPQVLTRLDPSTGELGHRWPLLLPGEKTLLYTIWYGHFDEARIAMLDLETGASIFVLEGGSDPRFVAPGWLVFARPKQVMAVPFDRRRGLVEATAVPVLEDIETADSLGAMELAVTVDGMAVYTPISEDARTLQWSDLAGRRLPIPIESRRIVDMALSPDDRRAALTVAAGNGSDVWIASLSDGELSRLTFDLRSAFPIWAPDGRRVIFSSALEDRTMRLMVKRVDGSGEAVTLVEPGALCLARNVASDGRVLYVQQHPGTTRWSLRTVALDGSGEPQLLFDRPQDTRLSRLSPDGRWLAYESKSGPDWEIFVRSLTGEGGLWQISIGGGSQPLWSADGRRLFYRHDDRLLAVAVDDDGSSFQAGAREALVDLGAALSYDLSSDGQSLLILRSAAESPYRHLRLILGWSAELERLASATAP